VIVFPNCKINLGLHVTAKRSDGYHELETVFYPVAVQDALEIVKGAETRITVTGMAAGDAQENSCRKAYEMLRKDFALPAVSIHLHKTIPVGAGLGGGSADAAFTLMLLNKKFGLQIGTEALLRYALLLGSDCPFFIKNKPCFATGRGEQLEPLPLDLSGYKIVLVNPGIPINTAWAFQQITPRRPAGNLKEIIQLPVEHWKNSLSNDFEKTVTVHHPAIGGCIEELYRMGALYAAMSGSGATVYGIFHKQAQPQFSFPLAYFVKEC
jgi:4-diphosphocytidyl-2-C-methyl-D-erythritol kinase